MADAIMSGTSGCLLGGRSPSGLGRARSPDGTHPARSGELWRWGQGTCCAQGGSWPRGWPRAGVDSGQCSPGCRPRGPSPPSPPTPRRRSGVRWGAARPGGAEESLRHHGDGRTAPGRAQGRVTNVLASTRVLHPVPSASPPPALPGHRGTEPKCLWLRNESLGLRPALPSNIWGSSALAPSRRKFQCRWLRARTPLRLGPRGRPAFGFNYAEIKGLVFLSTS